MSSQKKPKKGSGKKPAAKKNAQTRLRDESIFSHFRREIWGVVCILLAVLVLLSGFARQSALGQLFMGLVGRTGLIVLPIGLLLCAVALLFHGDRPVTMRILCSLSFAVLVCAVAHLAADARLSWSGGLLSRLYEGGKDGTTGGVVGGLTAMLFSLPGGKPVGWAITILLLLVTLPASVNLTLTGLLRAINNHRDELRATRREKERKEPAEALVEHVVRTRQVREEHRQVRAERRQNRNRFEYDLPVDDPTVQTAEKPAATVRPAGRPKQVEQSPDETEFLEVPHHRSDFDLPVDGPILPVDPVQTAPQPEPPAPPAPKLVPDPSTAEPGQTIPMAEVKVPAQPSEKLKAGEALQAAAEVGAEIANLAAAAPEPPVYVFPSTDLLDYASNDSVDASAEMRENTRRLTEKLACFNVDAKIVNVTRGPNVTMYELQLAQGVRLSKLTGLADDIALELGAPSVRISAIPDKNSMVGIEVPNKQVSTVSLREILESREFKNARSKVSFAVGKDINGTCVIGDIAKFPHVLIAGTTGSGKSVCTNSILISILYKATPEEVKLIVVDPKMVEFGIYNGVPHLLIPVVTDAKKAAGALQWAVSEMMRRYRTLSEAGVRDIESYNKAASTDESLEPMPKLVVVIDELADLMMVAGKEVEEAICRIAQMGRAAGVHLVIATQRPSADVITGLMKANIPSRIALVVSSAMESRIILDATGAEKLIGRGDMLYAPLGKGKKRVQGCFVDEAGVQRVIDFVKSNGSADYNDEVQQEIELRAAQSGKGGSGGAASASSGASEPTDEDGGDELLPAAVEVILETGMASVSMLQRRLKLGYARAARIVDEMEERGIVGPFEGSKPRQLLITKEQWAAMQGGAPAPAADPAPVEE